MKPTSILIVEDDLLTAHDLKDLLQEHGYFVLDIAKSYTECQQILLQKVPDMVLLDISLRGSGQSGIEVAEILLKPQKIPYLFLTGHDDVSTFEAVKPLAPIAFLTKPYRAKDIIFQIELAVEEIRRRRDSIKSPVHADTFYVYCEHAHLRIQKSEIVLIEAETSYSRIFLKGQAKPVLLTLHLKKMTTFLPTANFYRLSRKHVINLNYLKRFDQDVVWLDSLDFPIPIPQQGRKELMNQLAIVKID